MSMLRYPLRHLRTGTSVSILITQLAPECRAIIILRRELLAQVWQKSLQFASAWPSLALFGKLICSEETVYSLATDPHLSGNLMDTRTLGVQLAHLCIPLIATLTSLLLQSFSPVARCSHGLLGYIWSNHRGINECYHWV
jgi:hypothetical protein